MEESPAWIRTHAKGISISIKVQTRSSRAGLQGLTSDSQAIKWGLKSAPVDGKANAELVEAVSEFLGISKGKVSILKGETANAKVLLIEGLDFEEAKERICSQLR